MNPVTLTIGEIAWSHYLPAKRQRRRTNTCDGYESSIRLYVAPRWGGMAIAEIEPDDVQAWVDDLAKTDAGPGGAWKAYKCLRQIVRWALAKWKMRVYDPTQHVEKPRVPAYRPETLTHRRMKRLIRGMVGCECESTFVLSAALGLRPGESYALRWEQINWRTGLVPIRATLQLASDGLNEWPTKTAKGERDLYLPPWALDRLHQIWVERGRPRGRIIGGMKPGQVTYRIQRWIKQHRLPRVTMKNLRHTWATIAAQSGVTIELVASMLGHANVGTSYRYYYALTRAAVTRAQRRVSRRLLGKTSDDMYKGIVLMPAFPGALPAAA
ncbi:tyrosine-type recombinase/integrase [Adlercreutzia caecimuris]|uniref:tyrosine-type recombinase/integrase n=1 Tax=Adlercreutzia caecimuris TaxID=671266 RepID=UPI00258FF166|nr:tyrosine-type recombinase/integrase [Adlercreutzia caecimuris]